MWCWVPVRSIRHSSLCSLAIIVSGYGLFKSNVSCLLRSKLYQPTDPHDDGGFSLMYAAGNVVYYRTYRLWLRPGRVQLGDGLWPGGGWHNQYGHFLMWQSSFHSLPGELIKSTACDKLILPNWGWLLVLLVGRRLR